MPRLFLVLLIALLLAAPADAAVRPGWAPTGALSSAHSFHTATLLPNGKVLIAGGDRDGVALDTAELYDPATGQWSPAARLITPRTAATATLLGNGKVLVAGGYGPTTAQVTNKAELYDPATNSWTAVDAMKVGHVRGTATLLRDGKVLVAGGEPGVANAEVFNPANNSWKDVGPLARGRFDDAAALLADGKVLVAGGFSGGFGFVATAELYDPQTEQFTPAGSIAPARSFLTLTTLPGGRVLAAGGATDTNAPVTTSQLYEPASKTWSPAAPLTTARYWHAVSALTDGRVLVSAGIGPGGAPTATTEIYDPASGVWSPAGSISSGRYAHSSTLLADGRVLTTGGYSGQFWATSDLWTPATSLASDPAVMFGDQTTGATLPGAVQITNTGDSPLLLEAFALGGAQPGEFSVNGDTCRVVAPRTTCVLGVGFAPAAAGPRSATLTFSANTATGTHAVTLSGRGVAPAGQPTPPPAQLRRVTALLDYKFSRYSRRNTRFTRLVIKVNTGTTVTATCTRGCASKRVLKRNAKGTVSLKALIRKPVKAGSSIRVTVTQTGRVGAVLTLSVRKGKAPKLSTRCLPPGAKKTIACS